MLGLEDRVALVTGGSRGIGKAIALRLAQAGCRKVVITYAKNSTAAESVVEDIRKAGSEAAAVGFDVADAEATGIALEQVQADHGPVGVLVNNAGVARDALLMRVSPEAMEESWRTNVSGALFCTKALIRGMMKQRWGRVVFVSSVVAEGGNPGQAVYSSTKAAVIGLTKTLSREYASRGITVNAVAPGFIETDMTASIDGDMREKIASEIPLGRLGTPEDVAHSVAFLAADSGAYITGQVLRVNGGLYL